MRRTNGIGVFRDLFEVKLNDFLWSMICSSYRGLLEPVGSVGDFYCATSIEVGTVLMVEHKEQSIVAPYVKRPVVQAKTETQVLSERVVGNGKPQHHIL